MRDIQNMSCKAKPQFISVSANVVLIIIGFYFCFFNQTIFAQKGYSTPWTDTSPINGIEQLWQCLQYDGWSEEEKMVLAETGWTVMIHVGANGHARMEDVLGISDAEIKRKMRDKACLGDFVPRMLDGTALPAYYFVYHNTVAQVARQMREGPDAFELFGLDLADEDLAEVRYGRMGIDFFGGAYVPVFTGNAADYFSPGIGGSFGLSIRFLRHLTFGASIAYANHYTTNTLPENSALREGRSVGNFGAAFMLTGDLKYFSLSISGGFTEMGINAELTELSPVSTVSLSGYTAGLRIDVPVWSFTDKLGFNKGSAFRNSSGLGVMLGARYNHFEAANLRGWMIETGINYRWRKKDIESFRLRNSFYER